MNKQQIIKKLNFLTNHLEDLPGYCFTVIKWQPEDVIENLSDFDVRIIIDFKSNSATQELNKKLSELYLSNLRNSLVNSRTFEHPPNIHYFDELLRNFGNSPEVATWTLIHGDGKKFVKIKNYYISQKFNIDDRNHYIRILKSKRLYSLKRELVYDHVPPEQFKKYCLVWRYYATSLYAYSSLYAGKRMEGKYKSIKFMAKSFPQLKMANYDLLRRAVTDGGLSVKLLWKKLTADLNLLQKEVDTNEATVTENKYVYAKALNRSVILLRNKISRLTYYLGDQYLRLPFPKGLFANLVLRETDDMHMIHSNLDNAIYEFNNYLLAKNKVLYKKTVFHLRECSNLLKRTIRTAKQLERYLLFSKSSISEFEDLNRLLTTDDELLAQIMKKKNKYTLFTIKNDAIRRNIQDKIINELEKHYKIIDTKRKVLTKSEVRKIKSYEWNHNWSPKPTKYIKELSFAYEAKEVIVVLCMIKDKNIDAIEFGDKLKGGHHVAHLCSTNTIRGKFVERSIVDRIKIDKNGVSILYNSQGKEISLAPNVIHSVDCQEELLLHLNLFFPESNALLKS